MDDESELESLASERAKALVNALESGRVPQAKLLTTRVHENPKFDVVRLALEVSVAQRAPVAIRSVEELEIYFSRSSDDLPMVVPVRQDFPLDQLHIMQGGRGVPNSICLWDIPFSDIRSTLTPVGLLQRIQTWLEKAADGELHDPDQPAEPLLYVADAVLILPTKVAGKAAEELSVASISQQENGTAYIRLSENLDRNKNEEYSVVPFTLGPVQQAPTRIAPRNLEDLFQLPEGLGSSLRAQISDWLKCSDNRRHLETEHVIIVIQIQKRRNEASEDITIETWAFTLGCTWAQLGTELGILDRAPDTKNVGLILVTPEPSDLSKIGVSPAIIVYDCDAQALAEASGLDNQSETDVLAIGLGALGSHVFANLCRSGFGTWSIIDSDVFMPHNSARHALGQYYSGHFKSDALAHFSREILEAGSAIKDTLKADVLALGDDEERFLNLAAESDIVLDMSASVPVARALCSIEKRGRLISTFFNPSGTDLVVLQEDAKGEIDMWDLEASYYAALVDEDAFSGHLTEKNPTLRYGNGCRDVSVQLANDQVSLLSSIATRQIRRLSSNASAEATIWRSDIENGTVAKHSVSVSPSTELKLDDWRVRVASATAKKLKDLRTQSIPNETGGSLLGLIDHTEKLIVINHQIPAPPDSLGRPHCFERGTANLSEETQSLLRRTLGQVRYIGEWHSHPPGIEAIPSRQDEKMYAGLTKLFVGASEPFLMAIISENNLFLRLFVNETIGEITIPLEKVGV